jgi:AcrR family transcriptional regulator
MAAARKVFADEGYSMATVDDIAQTAGCSKGAYYFHFASKEDVLLALVDEWAATRLRLLTESFGSHANAGQALEATLEAVFSLDTAEGRDRQLLLEFWSQGERNAKVSKRLAEGYRAERALLVRAFRKAQQKQAYASELGAEASAELALSLHYGLAAQRGLAAKPNASRRGARAAQTLLTSRVKAEEQAG